MDGPRLSRRRLFQASDALAIGVGLGAALRRTGMSADVVAATDLSGETRDVSGATVDSWLAIDGEGNVTVYAGKVELGTGVKTALAQIVAEELDVPFDRVTMVLGDTALTPDQGTTAGSKTIQNAGPVLRQAAAAARQILLTRASARLEVAVDDLQVRDGVIEVRGNPTTRVSYGELADQPFAQTATAGVPVKSPADYTIVGTSAPRVDLLAKLTGGEAFVQDVRLAGMRHGRVVRPHVRTMDGVGAVVEAVDDTAARQAPGVVAVVHEGSFVGVVAEREEQAIAAAEALRVTWSTPAELPDQASYDAQITTLDIETVEVVRTGDVDAALVTADKTIEATYRFPSQAHASLGPSCAVADVRGGEATIYSATQGVYALRNTLAALLGIESERVRVIHREGAGCYGQNGADDVAADAALLSRAVGRPVRVQWSRQDEFAWEPKSPAMVSRLRGGLDADGRVVGWDYQVWTPGHSSRPNGQLGGLLAGQLLDPSAEPTPRRRGGGDRNAAHTYDFPHNRVTVHWLQTTPLRCSSLRSLGGLANTTANESFLDELAALAEADPVAFRLRHLDDPRAIAVIEKAAEVAEWQSRPSPSPSADVSSVKPLTGRGIAFARYETAYTYVAVVAEVAVAPATGAVRVTRVTVAHDCGQVINPDGVANQIEGNVIQGISRALHETVAFDRTRVTSLDFSTYRIATFPEAPDLRIALIDRPDEPPLGAGEPAICPMVAAIGNAIFDATGVRLRTAPFTAERVMAALHTG